MPHEHFLQFDIKPFHREESPLLRFYVKSNDSDVDILNISLFNETLLLKYNSNDTHHKHMIRIHLVSNSSNWNSIKIHQEKEHPYSCVTVSVNGYRKARILYLAKDYQNVVVYSKEQWNIFVEERRGFEK